MRRVTPWGEGALVGALTGALYWFTLSPGVGAGDGGELLLAAQTLGVPHPPGYPLWTLLARLAAAVPAGDLPLRVNALSALLTAIAAALLWLLCRRAGLKLLPAAVATALFASAIPVWRAAVEAEVYALASVAFLAMAHLAWGARAARTRGPRADALFFFVAGLACLAHQTLAAPAALFAVFVLARRFTWSRALRAGIAGLVGLTPSLYVPIRAAAGSAFAWKERAPLAAWGDVFTREAYGGLLQNRWRLDFVTADLAGMLATIAAGAGVAALALAAAGFLANERPGARARRLLLPSLAAAATVPLGLAVLVVYSPDAEHAAQVEPFLIPAFAAVALLAGVGTAWAVSRPGRRLVGAACGVAALATVALHAGVADRRGFRIPERYGRDLLAAAPHGAVVVLDGDNETFLAAYLTRVEGVRPDLAIVHRRGCAFGDAYRLAGLPRAAWPAREHAIDLERITRGDRPVFFASPPADLVAAGVVFVPAGLLARALPPGSKPPGASSAWVPPGDWPRSTALLAGRPERFDFVTRKAAVSYSDAAARALWRAGDVSGARAWFVDAARVGYDMPEAHWNVAVAAAVDGDPGAALDALLAARALAPHRAESASRIAVFLATAGRNADAARWFERAYKAEPSAALAHDAARAWSLAGDVARAMQWRALATPVTAGRIG